MASIHRETVVDVGAEQAWAALRTVGAAHELFAPVLTDGELNGETRRVRFANGMVVNERIVDVDDGMRRVATACSTRPACGITTRRCRCWTRAPTGAALCGSRIFCRRTPAAR